MESIGRDNIKVTNYVAEEQLKDNNRFRPVIVIGFILVILFLTIAYASLAINYGVKIHEPRRTTTEVKGDDIVVTTTTKPGETTRPTRPSTTTTTLQTRSTIIPFWDIHFANLDEFAGSNAAVVPAHIVNKTDVNFEVVFRNPGEYYKFKVDMVNGGNYNAKVYGILQKQLTPDQARFLTISYTYLDGTEIKEGDELPAGQTRTMIVDIKFKDDVLPSDLPDGDTVVNISYELVYVEK